MVTKQDVIAALNRENEFVQHYVGRALVVLFNRQVQDEKQNNSTKHHNLRGFAPCDARSGSIGAKYYLKHGRLEDWQIEQWKKIHGKSPRLAKYWRQLDEAAKEKKDAQKAV